MGKSVGKDSGKAGARIVFSGVIPFKGFACMNVFGTLFIRKEYREMYERHPAAFLTLITHESIHTCQMRELLYVGFYLLYGLEWIARVITPPFGSTYMDISFEREAYRNEHTPGYPAARRRYAWTRYIAR